MEVVHRWSLLTLEDFNRGTKCNTSVHDSSLPWLCVVLASVFTGGVPSDVGSVGGLGSDGQTTANIITAGGGVLVTTGLVKQ